VSRTLPLRSASRWSADRVRNEFPALHVGNSRFNVTGEMIYPWMFDDHASLHPLHDAAHQTRRTRGLARKALGNWPQELTAPD
jgi:hypothetical protein